MFKDKVLISILFYFCFLSILKSEPVEFIVKFKSEKHLNKFVLQSKSNISKLFEQFNSKKIISQIQSNFGFSPNLYYSILIETSNSEAIKDLQIDENIEYAERVHLYKIEKSDYPSDSFAQYQWALKAVNGLNTINQYNGEGIIIGVIDTGIDFEHEDLKNQLWINESEDINNNGKFDPWDNEEFRNGISGDFDGLDNDGNGFIDDVIGYDFVDQQFAKFGDWSEPDPIPDDEGKHGTEVSGVIAAEGNNEIGIIGLAHKSKILTAKVFDITGNAETDDIAKGIIYAAVNGAKIINMSFGDPFESKLLADAIKFANSLGCILVASSGNDNNSNPHFPSDFEEVISVGGLTETGKRSSISNYGVNLSVIAPGENILTCERGNSYRRISGTSFAAPYVSAAAAILVQKYPNISASQVRSTIEASAKRMDIAGWNKFFGAGHLDVWEMLNIPALSNFDFSDFINYKFISKDQLIFQEKLFVQTPLFDSWKIEIIELGKNFFIPITDEFYNQTLSPLMIEFNLPEVTSDFNLSLSIKLKNGQILRRNRTVKLFNSDSSLKITHFAVNPAIMHGKRIIIVSAKANYPVEAFIEYFPNANPDLSVKLYEYDKKSNNNVFTLKEFYQKGEYKGRINFIIKKLNGLNDTLKKDFTFFYEPLEFLSSNYKEKTYTLPRAYIFNRVGDFLKNGGTNVIINNLNDFLIGTTELYNFKNNKFEKIDSLVKGWIPIGVGDTKGNGNLDILFTDRGKTMISTSESISGNPFSKVIFESIPGVTFWGEGLYDFDKDGKSEILGYNDSTYFTYKYSGNNYFPYKILELPKTLKKGVVKGSLVGDFDGDGNIEVFHSNYYGNLFIHEFKNGEFSLEWIDSTDYGYSNPIVSQIKLNNKSNPSIIIGTYGSKLISGDEEFVDIIWSFRILNSNLENNYDVKTFENFLGVQAGIEPRVGLAYRNGVAAGNLDQDSGEELIISTFPNTYVMKWKEDKFFPLWQYKYSFSNSAFIFDFDNNGINELGIATYDSTRFFEINENSNKPQSPVIYDAFSESSNTGKIKWHKLEGITEYRIYTLKQKQDGSLEVKLINNTKNDSVSITELIPESYNYFLVTSVNNLNQESEFSELVKIFAHQPYEPLSYQIMSNNIIKVSFNGKMKSYIENPNLFQLLAENNTLAFIPNSVQTIADSSFLLIFNSELPQGNAKLIINSFRDFYNSPTLAKDFGIKIEVENMPSELFLSSLDVISVNELILKYSESVNEFDALNSSNYSLSPFGSVVNVEKIDEITIRLILDQEIGKRNITGELYSITAKNVKAISGKLLTIGGGNTLSFVLTKENSNKVIAFPSPFSLSKNEFLNFGNLPSDIKIKIMDLNGKILKEIEDKSADGGLSWDLVGENGKKLEAGIYIFLITGRNSAGEELEYEYKKFSVIP